MIGGPSLTMYWAKSGFPLAIIIICTCIYLFHYLYEVVYFNINNGGTDVCIIVYLFGGALLLGTLPFNLLFVATFM